jgi:hypothetical protein
MDDFNIGSLHESKNEWSSRLVTILTPVIFEGLRSILNESTKLCIQNQENDKYLMTYQNLLRRIPQWNNEIVSQEVSRIIEKSKCNYLEDLISCVHIIQLKILTAMRVGQKQKKIDIVIPKLNDFVHKCYINISRKIYSNVYLFETDISPLNAQKNNREIEIIIQEGIVNTIRESIPVESIIKAYMEETEEKDYEEEIIEEVIEEPKVNMSGGNENIPSNIEPINKVESLDLIGNKNSISFSDVDSSLDINNIEEAIKAPKDIKTLEDISEKRNLERKIEEEEENDENESLKIGSEPIPLDSLDIHNLDMDKMELNLPDLIGDIEILS